MLTKKDLVNQSVFTLGTDGNYYDGNWDYALCFEANGAVLRVHCEVDGILEPIKNLVSLTDLLETIEILNI